MIYSIDFGTSNSLLGAATKDGVTSPIPLDEAHEDQSVLRSLMFFADEGEISFGQKAIQRYVETVGEGRFLRSIKKFLPSQAFTSTRIGNKAYRLEELIGRFLREMKSRADLHFDQEVDQVLMGRPAKFSMKPEEDQLAQDRLEQAAHLAGFKEVHFFPEPLAAAYEVQSEIHEEKILLVVDLGGGTSDFTVMKLGPHRFRDEDVLSIGGVAVAGDALDGTIMTEAIGPFLGTKTKYQLPMSHNILTMSPELKRKLSSPADITLLSRTDIMTYLNDVKKAALEGQAKENMERLFVLIEDNLGFPIFEEIERSKKSACIEGVAHFHYKYPDLDIQTDFSRADFDHFSQAKVDQIFKELDETILMAQLQANDIDLICCTGGTSKVPAVSERLVSRFGQHKIQSRREFHSVIHGLSERAFDLIQA